MKTERPYLHLPSWGFFLLTFLAIVLGMVLRKLYGLPTPLIVALCYLVFYLYYLTRLQPEAEPRPDFPAGGQALGYAANFAAVALFCGLCVPGFWKQEPLWLASQYVLYLGTAALVEESLFREHLLTRLHRTGTSPGLAILVSALYSSFLYVPTHWIEWPLRLLPGLFCARLYWQTRRLDLCIGLRWAWGCLIYTGLRATPGTWDKPACLGFVLGAALALGWLFAGNAFLARRHRASPLWN